MMSAKAVHEYLSNVKHLKIFLSSVVLRPSFVAKEDVLLTP